MEKVLALLLAAVFMSGCSLKKEQTHFAEKVEKILYVAEIQNCVSRQLQCGKNGVKFHKFYRHPLVLEQEGKHVVLFIYVNVDVDKDKKHDYRVQYSDKYGRAQNYLWSDPEMPHSIRVGVLSLLDRVLS